MTLVRRERQPYKLETMLRIHFMQQWFNLTDPAMEEALHDIASMRQFAGLSLTRGSLPDETFRHLLEAHGLAVQQLSQAQGLFVRQGTVRSVSDRNFSRRVCLRLPT